MNGFEHETHKKLQGMHDDITIHAQGEELEYDTIKKILLKEFGKSIDIISPKITHYCMLTTDESRLPYLVCLTGIEMESKILEKLATLMKISKEQLEELKRPYALLLGSSLTAALNGATGQQLRILLPDMQSLTHHKMSFHTAEAVMLGSFQTGMEEFDMNIAFCSLETMKCLIDSSITQVGINLKPSIEQKVVLKKMRKRFGTALSIYSWQELYPALLEATTLEKYVMFFILSLVVLIASIGILALLFMFINLKRVEITLLIIHGISIGQIQRAYLILGCGISMAASIFGTIASFLCAYALNTFQLIRLPQIYGLTHLPAIMSVNIVISVNILVFLLSLVCCLLATKQIACLKAADVLRFEG